MELWQLMAREEIRETFTRYATAADGGKLHDLAAVFAEDGTLDVHGSGSATGRDGIVTLLASLRKAPLPVPEPAARPMLRHFVTNIHFRRLTPDEAETTAYFCAFTGVGPDHWGRYFDTHVRVDDQWLIRHRVARVEASAPVSWHVDQLAASGD